MNTNIIILLLILIPILYILFTSYHTEKSTINSNDDTNIKTIPCGVLSSLTIKKCDKKDEKDICSSCQCSSDPNIIENCMTCTEVNDQNKYIVPLSKEDCKDPFVFDDNTKKCQLKNGKYCLPVKMNNINCNPYTSDKVLTLDENLYQWKCLCKNPYKFTGLDCSNIKICGMFGSSNNPNLNNNRALIQKGTRLKPDYWKKDSKWDPLTDSECLCNEGEFNEEKSQSCLPTTCGQGASADSTNKECIGCPKNHISCHRINTPDKGICIIPSCIPDPCGGEGKGNLSDSNDSDCICDPEYFDLPDPNSVIGHSCQNPCLDNPCGERGTCYVWTKDNDNIVWTINPVNSTTYSFKINNKYLSSNFTLKDVGDSTTTFSIEGIFGTDQSVYIKNGSNYLNFKDKNTISQKDNLLIKLLQDSDCVKTKSEFKLQNLDGSYISGNLVSDQTIDTNSQSWKGTARCKDCKSGNIQDSRGYCNQTNPGSCGCKGQGFLNMDCQVNANHCNNGYSPSCNLNVFQHRCDCTCIRG
jgi:hypothetical protein